MRVFLDTNVWLAAFLTRGSCQELMEYCLEAHDLYTSSFILQEIEEKLTKKLKFPAAHVKVLIHFICAQAHLATEVAIGKKLCRDPKDDKVLAAALGARASCLVTGDQDLLILKKVGPLPIVSPSDFWKWEKS